MTSRFTAYGRGGAAIPFAPVPTKTSGVPSGNTAYNFGQLIWDEADATWYAYSGSSVFTALGGGSISGITSLNSIYPAAGGNFTLTAGTGVTLTAGTNAITIGLTGGGVAIDSFAPDAGTNPVVPTAAGLLTMAGTANQITTTGGTNVLTFSIPSVFNAPGTVTAATGITATTGGVTASAGNIVATLGNITATAGSVSAGTTVTAGTGVTATTGNITATAGVLLAGGDTGGVASTTAISNANSTTIGAGVGSVKMSTGNNADNTAWIKIYIGTTAYWIPAWTTNAP